MIFLKVRIHPDKQGHRVLGERGREENVRLAGRKENGLVIGRGLPCDKGEEGDRKIDEYNEGGGCSVIMKKGSGRNKSESFKTLE